MSIGTKAIQTETPAEAASDTTPFPNFSADSLAQTKEQKNAQELFTTVVELDRAQISIGKETKPS